MPLAPEEIDALYGVPADAAAGAVGDASTTNPDQEAERRRTARDAGLDPIVRGGPEFDRMVQQGAATNRARPQLDQAPRTAAYLARPENAAVAHDDVENLSWWEKVLQYRPGPGVALSAPLPLKLFGAVVGGGAVTGGAYGEYAGNNPEEAAADIKNVPRAFGEGMEDVRFNNLASRMATGAATPAERREFREWQARRNAAAQADTRPPPGPFSTAARTAPQILEGVARSGPEMTAGAGLWAGGAFMLGQAGPQIAAPEEVVTVPSAAFTGAMVGLRVGYAKTSFTQNTGAAYSEFSQIMGADGRPLDEGAVRLAALASGAVTAGLDSVGFESLLRLAGVKALGKDKIAELLRRPEVISALSNVAKRYGVMVTSEASTEAVQEAVQILAGEALRMEQGEAPGTTVAQAGERVKEAFIQGGQAAMVLGAPAAGVGATVEVSRAQQQRQAAEEQQQVFDAIGQNAEASRLRERLPQDYQAFVDEVTRDGPVANVYVDANALTEFFQSKGVDPAQGAAEMGITADDLATAQASGGMVTVTTGTYAARIAGTELDAGLRDHMTFRPDIPTRAQAKAMEEAAPELDEAQRLLAEDEAALDVAETAAVKARRERYTAELSSGGQFTPSQVANIVQFRVEADLAQAKDAGLTIEQFNAQYPVERVVATPPVAARAQVRVNRAAAPTGPLGNTITSAATAGGVSPSYMIALAAKESSFRPDAAADTSSAVGLYQFIDGTWIGVMRQHGTPEEQRIAATIRTGRGGRAIITNEAQRQLMAARTDAATSSRMAAALTADNARALKAKLGRDPTDAELYMVHFIGSASKVASFLQADPNATAADLLPAAAKSNRSIFYNKDGTPRTVAQVRERLSKGFNGEAITVPDGAASETVAQGMTPITPEAAPEIAPDAGVAPQATPQTAAQQPALDAGAEFDALVAGATPGQQTGQPGGVSQAQGMVAAMMRPAPEARAALPDLVTQVAELQSSPKADKAAQGPSLAQFIAAQGGIADEGGEFAAIDADAGRRGKHRITRKEGGITAGDMAQRAVEAGYFVDRAAEATVDGPSLIEALRAELGGKPRYANQEAPTPEQERAASLRDEIDRRGIPMDADPQEIARQLKEARDNDDLQAALDQYESDAIEYDQGMTRDDAAQFVLSRALSDSIRSALDLQRPPPFAMAIPDPVVMGRIADAYEAAPLYQDTEKMRRSYRVLIDHTMLQLRAMAGNITFEPWAGQGEPYANSAAMMDDVANNRHLWFFRTENGFGEGADTTDHPLLEPTDVMGSDGKPLLANDAFRVVHDFFGHTQRSLNFGPVGELNAFLEHAAMYPEEALYALAVETLMQNAWVNFGPHMRRQDGSFPVKGDADYVPIPKRRFADQKVFVPRWSVIQDAFDLQAKAEATASREARSGRLEAARRGARGSDEGLAFVPGQPRDLNPALAALAAWTPARVTDLLDTYAYKHQPRTKAWATRMSPDEFLGLTASPEGRAIIAAETAPLDENMLAGQTQPIFLYVEPNGKVTGHEGRHRMTALKMAGVDSVPVVIWGSDGAKERQPVPEMRLTPQGSRRMPLETGDAATVINRLVPISYEYERTLNEEFGGDARVLFQSRPDLFYSALGRAVQTSKTAKASPRQWIATLQNTPGVKKEELEWSGVLDWLAAEEERMTLQITREDLAAFVDQNGVKIEEVTQAYLTPEQTAERDAYVAARADALREEWINEDEEHAFQSYAFDSDLYVEEREPDDPDDAPEWFVMSGGNAVSSAHATEEDAQETMWEYEAEAESDARERWRDRWRPQDHGRYTDAEEAAEMEWDEQHAPPEPAYENFTVSGGEDYRVVLLKLPVSEEAFYIEDPATGETKRNPRYREPFTAGHWSDHNVLAHIRYKTRLAPDGRRVLFVEEIQSDWHQKARQAAKAHFERTGEVISGYARVGTAEEKRLAAQRYDAALRSVVVAGDTMLIPANEWIAAVRPLAEAAAPNSDIKNAWLIMLENRHSYLELPTPAKARQLAAQLLIVDRRMDGLGSVPAVRAAMMSAVDSVLAAHLRVGEAEQQKAALEGEGGLPDAPFKTAWTALAMKRVIRLAAEEGYDRVAWINGDQQNGGKTQQEPGIVPVYNRNLVNVARDLVKRHGAVVAREDIGVMRESGVSGEIVMSNMGIPPKEQSAYWASLEPDERDRLIDEFRAEMDKGHNGFDITDSLREAALGGFSLFQDQARDQTQTPAFKAWFGDSKVVDEDGAPMRVYHGTKEDFEAFAPTTGGIHLGTTEQANMRVSGEGKNIIPAYVRIERPRRSKDTGGSWAAAIKSAKAAGHDGIVYLNRYEGLSSEVIERLSDSGALAKLDRMSDADFRRAVPEARDSYIAFEPAQIKSAIGNAGTFDPANPSILAQDDLGPGAKRGSVSFPGGKLGEGRQATINLFAQADLSTFLHETGHVFLERLVAMSAMPDAPQHIRDRMNTVLQWFNVPDASHIGVKEHEMWAEAFEQYLYEGRSPSLSLKSVFEAFRAWLVFIYRRARGVSLLINDDIRAVMDRMVATEDAIALARGEGGQAMTAADLGLPPEQAAVYERAQADAIAEAQGEADRRVLRAVRQQQEAWWKAERARVREETDADVAARPVYRAFEWLAHGRWLNGQPPEGLAEVKLDRQAIAADYGAEMLDRLPKGAQFARVYGEDGTHPDVVAEVFGFETGGELLEALATAEKRAVVVDRETDAAMKEAHPDPMETGELPDIALEATHNVSAQRVLEIQYRAMSGRPLHRGIAEAARLAQTTRTLRDLRSPDKHLVAERKAANAAIAAFKKGDREEGARQKYRQIVAFHTWKEARRAREQIEMAERLFAKVTGGKQDNVAKARNMDLVQAARAILEAYGYGGARNNPMAYMALVREYDPDLADALDPQVLAASEGATGDTATLTLDEFMGLYDTVNALWVLAKRTRQIEIDGRKMALDDAAGQLADVIGARLLAKGTADKGMTASLTEGQRILRGISGLRASLRRVEHWAMLMDGGVPGPFTRLIWRPVSEAADRHRAYSGEKRRVLADLLKDVQPGITWKKITAQEIGHVFASKLELLHAILHTGNDSNRRKLLLGGHGMGGWASVADDGTLDTRRWDALINRLIKDGTLTKADFDFAQGVWDLLETMKPEAQKAHRAIYGRYFDEVTANAFNTPWGEYRGGYVPAQVDTALVQDADLRAEAERVNENTSFMFPTAARGFTKSRVENYTKPLLLDLRLLSSHIDKVSMFANLAAPVRDTTRLLGQADVKEGLGALDPVVMKDMLLPFLNRAVRQTVETPTAGEGGRLVDAVARGIRSRAGMQVMTANLVNALQQITGFSITMLKVKPTHLARALFLMVKAPAETADLISAASPMMRERLKSQSIEAAQDLSEMLTRPNLYSQAKAFTGRHAYFLQHAFQNVVDTISWLGANSQALDEGKSDKEAVRLADAAVRQTQGSLNPEDISRYESGPALLRMFSQFASYFNMQGNILLTESMLAGESKNYTRLAWVILMGFAVPALVADAIKRGLTGGFDDEEEDGYLDEVLDWITGSLFRGGTALIPLVGPSVLAFANTWNDKPYDDKLALSPGVSMVDVALRTPAEVYEVLQGEGDKSKTVKDVFTMLGMATGLPFGPLGRPIGYALDVEEGDVTPVDTTDAVRGAITGTATERSKN